MLNAYKYQVLSTCSVLGSILGTLTFLLIEPHWSIITQWDSKERHYQIFWPHGQNFWESSHIYCFYFLTFLSVFNLLHSGICLHQSIWNCFFNKLWNIFYNLISHDLQRLTWWITLPPSSFLATFYLGFLLTSPSISHSLSYTSFLLRTTKCWDSLGFHPTLLTQAPCSSHPYSSVPITSSTIYKLYLLNPSFHS